MPFRHRPSLSIKSLTLRRDVSRVISGRDACLAATSPESALIRFAVLDRRGDPRSFGKSRVEHPMSFIDGAEALLPSACCFALGGRCVSTGHRMRSIMDNTR